MLASLNEGYGKRGWLDRLNNHHISVAFSGGVGLTYKRKKILSVKKSQRDRRFGYIVPT